MKNCADEYVINCILYYYLTGFHGSLVDESKGDNDEDERKEGSQLGGE